MKKVYYYKNENQDFEGGNINPIAITSEYKYLHKNIFWNILSFIVYRLIAMPIAYIYSKMAFSIKYENRELLKKSKNSGYFIYSNHTQPILDTFIPTLANFPKKAYIIAHPDNVSIPFLGKINKMMGALPLPSDIKSMKNFLDSIEKIINKKGVVSVYPEAHVWPYYTKIRDYEVTSFKYPVKLNVPVYVFTTTYIKRKNRRPKIVVYIDGPFLPNRDLKMKEAQQELKDNVYNTMIKRAKNSNVEYVKYIKIEDDSND